MRRVKAAFSSGVPTSVHRVVGMDDIAAQWSPELRFVCQVKSNSDRATVERLRTAGLTNLPWVEGDSLQPGDIVSPRPDDGFATVLFRERDQHHALLLTNRCNSYCLMCSQPPTAHRDPWLVEQAAEVARHLRFSPPAMGLSGGEPLLLGADLRRIMEVFRRQHPATRLEVLTNGRLLADLTTVDAVLAGWTGQSKWLVPLYGHADFLHDFLVQAHGAFDQTVEGLLVLQEHGQAIQLRIVMIRPVLECLQELASFIGRNLPFVQEVALMACEPVGFALANREHCEVDLLDWTQTLEAAVREFQRHRIPYLFMNTPLCAIPKPLWPNAHRSISDWKNVYAEECAACKVKDDCSGLFAWHDATHGWKPSQVRAVLA